MKKLRNTIITPLLLIIVIFSCQKEPADTFVPSRMFAPTNLALAYKGDTAVTITWVAPIYTSGIAITYKLEISKDSTFKTSPDVSLKVGSITRTVSDDTLNVKTPYFARVMANVTNGIAASDWSVATPRINLVGLQMFKAIPSSDITSTTVLLSWIPNPRATKIAVTGSNGVVTEVPLLVGDIVAAKKMVANLLPLTAYTAAIYLGTSKRGTINFTTR